MRKGQTTARSARTKGGDGLKPKDCSTRKTPTDRIRDLWKDGKSPHPDLVKAAIVGEMIGLVAGLQARYIKDE